LDRTFREQVRRAVGMELDGSVESLAVVDHYLGMGRDEDRAPILALLAAGAGAYFGELVRRAMGAIWIGDGKDPRRLRLLLEPQFLYFAPVDVALEAVLAGSPGPADGAEGDPGDVDAAFHLQTGPEAEDDASSWIEARLAEVPPVPEDQFHTLTCRFETLQLILELLAAKQAQEGGSPRSLGVADYLTALAADN
jgi:hypothetical protein